MTKADIVKAVAESTGLEKAAVASAIEGFMDTVKASLAQGEPVYLRGFGTFGIKHRAEKTARNITAQKTIVIPAKDIPAFKPCNEFKAMVKK